MESKIKLSLKIFVLFLIVNTFLVNSINAEMYSYSDAGVQYETKILDEFENNKWVDVIVDVKDISNITISNKDSIETQIEKDKQRNKFFNSITESILNTLSDNEFRYKDKTDRTIFGYITKEGFNKLLNNSDVKSIYLEKYVSLFGKDNIGLSYGGGQGLDLSSAVVFIIFIVIILIVYVVIKRVKKRKWLKR